MKWSLTAIAAALALSACHRDASVPATDDTAASDSQPAAPAPFTPATGSQVAPQDISLLEQINRENIHVIGSALPGIVRISSTIAVDPRQEMAGNLTHIPFPFERHDTTPSARSPTARA